jgi:glutamyl-tRNA reductase
VVVGARISKSGSAMPQPGDVQGYSQPVAPGASGLAIVLSEVARARQRVDVVLTATGAPGLLLERADLEAVVEERRGRPLLVVDVAVPRDVDPGAADVPGITLLDMDDLRSFVAAGLDERRKEIARVQAIIHEEVDRHQAHRTARRAAPVIAALRGQAEAVRQAELARFASRLESLDPTQREAVDALTRGILAKLLHEPTVRLKNAAGSPAGERLADTLRALFDLE